MIDLSKFCEALPWWNFDSSRPFVRGGFTYATDARICVRVVTPGKPDSVAPDASRPFPPVEAVFAAPDEQTVWLPWPTLDRQVEEAVCAACGGDGRALESGDPDAVCPVCAGESKWTATKQAVGPQLVDGRYDDLIRQLPHVRFSARPEFGAFVRFRFDGGEGIVAPLSR